MKLKEEMREKLLKLKIAIDENKVRRNLSDMESVQAIALYDKLQSELYGGAKHGGDRKSGNQVSPDETWSQKKTAQDLNISTGNVNEAIQLAKALKEYPELAKEPSKKRALQKLKIKTRFENVSEIPSGTFNVIYADPPWEYSNTGFSSSVAGQYKTMSTLDICRMKIPSAKDTVLFLWATNPMLKDALEVISAWGFEYKTNFVWVKTSRGVGGFYVLGRHELLLISIKGKMLPIKVFPSVYKCPSFRHSVKPDDFYEIIEQMYPKQKYLELFARKQRKGWTSWGNEL